MVKGIPLRNRRGLDLVALVDDEDYERVARFRWNPLRRRLGGYYATRAVYGPERLPSGKLKKHTIYLHRFVMNAPPDREVDHRDLDGLNCVRSNMRLATPRQNRANTPGLSRDGRVYKGVRRESRHWGATCDGRYVGTFRTAEEAARAYDAAARRAFGEFAWTNYPDDGRPIPTPLTRSEIRRAQKRSAHLLDDYADGLPASQPADVSDVDWMVLQRRAAGETLDAIGRALGVTRERVRQREARAWRLIRAATESWEVAA
jgi:hypothetical protein